MCPRVKIITLIPYTLYLKKKTFLPLFPIGFNSIITTYTAHEFIKIFSYFLHDEIKLQYIELGEGR